MGRGERALMHEHLVSARHSSRRCFRVVGVAGGSDAITCVYATTCSIGLAPLRAPTISLGHTLGSIDRIARTTVKHAEGLRSCILDDRRRVVPACESVVPVDERLHVAEQRITLAELICVGRGDSVGDGLIYSISSVWRNDGLRVIRIARAGPANALWRRIRRKISSYKYKY